MVLDVQVKRSIFEHLSANEFESVLSWGKLSFRSSFPVYNKETCLFNAFSKLGCPSKYLLTLFHLCFEKKTRNIFHYFLFQVLSPPLWTVVSVTCWVFKHQGYLGIYRIADYSWSPEVPSDPTACDSVILGVMHQPDMWNSLRWSLILGGCYSHSLLTLLLKQESSLLEVNIYI